MKTFLVVYTRTFGRVRTASHRVLILPTFPRRANYEVHDIPPEGVTGLLEIGNCKAVDCPRPYWRD